MVIIVVASEKSLINGGYLFFNNYGYSLLAISFKMPPPLKTERVKMSEKKPVIEKGLILYKDYEFIFNFLSKEEIGEVVLTLLHTMDNPTLNPSDNDNINNAYNYIANRIIDYKEKRDKAIKNGKKGGNPLFKRDTTLNPTLNGGDKLKENKIKENKIKENNMFNDNVNEPENKYGFKGEVIKLTKKDFDRWLELFTNLNLEAELYNRDLWLSKQDFKTKCTWFQSTSSWFAKLDKERQPKDEQSGYKKLIQDKQKKLNRPLHGFEKQAIEEGRKVTSKIEIEMIKEWCRDNGYDETIC